jgi:hypothetical protein
MISRLSIALCLLPAFATAQDAVLPDWVPAGIVLPDPYDISQTMTIGSTNLLIVSVSDDPSGMIPEWQTVLADAGYALDTSMLFEQRLLFSGNGLESAQIVTRIADDADGFEIQIDAKRDSE